MEQIISLGSNCSVTYQLNKYNKRVISYPFDWSKISIKQLNSVLENNFKDFENVYVKKFSKNHNSSYVLSNKYNITFAHEVFNKYNLDEFTQLLIKRINNFTNNKISNNPIKFIRIELQPISLNYVKELEKLCLLLSKYFDNYTFLLLVSIDCNINWNDEFKFNFNSNFNIIIKNVVDYNNFVDWKMDYIDWNNLFTN